MKNTDYEPIYQIRILFLIEDILEELRSLEEYQTIIEDEMEILRQNGCKFSHIRNTADMLSKIEFKAKDMRWLLMEEFETQLKMKKRVPVLNQVVGNDLISAYSPLYEAMGKVYNIIKDIDINKTYAPSEVFFQRTDLVKLLIALKDSIKKIEGLTDKALNYQKEEFVK